MFDRFNRCAKCVNGQWLNIVEFVACLFIQLFQCWVQLFDCLTTRLLVFDGVLQRGGRIFAPFHWLLRGRLQILHHSLDGVAQWLEESTQYDDHFGGRCLVAIFVRLHLLHLLVHSTDDAFDHRESSVAHLHACLQPPPFDALHSSAESLAHTTEQAARRHGEIFSGRVKLLAEAFQDWGGILKVASAGNRCRQLNIVFAYFQF